MDKDDCIYPFRSLGVLSHLEWILRNQRNQSNQDGVMVGVHLDAGFKCRKCVAIAEG